MKDTIRAGKIRGASGGFTLLEVLIAVSILGMIMTILYMSFRTTLSAPDELGAIQERYVSLGRAMNRMAREIEMTFISLNYNNKYETSPKTLFKLKEGRLDFSAFAHLKITKNAKESDQCAISYFLKEDPSDRNKQNLMRRETNRLDKEPEKGGVSYAMLEDVLDFKIEAWNGDDWVLEWDVSKVEYLNKLPERLRISVTIFDDFGEKKTYVTETKIWLKDPIRF